MRLFECKEEVGLATCLLQFGTTSQTCESISDSHNKRSTSKETIVINESGPRRFPCAVGSLQQSGNFVLPLPHRLTEDFPDIDVMVDEENSETSDIFQDTEDNWSIAGDFIYHHHVVPRSASSLPIPLKYIDNRHRVRKCGGTRHSRLLEHRWCCHSLRLGELTRFQVLPPQPLADVAGRPKDG